MNNRHGAKLLLTLDAFGTIFTPREPVVKQYLDVAQRLGLASLDESLLQDSFRTSFREQSRLYPNYGKDSGMKAPEWWANAIKSTFKPFISKANPLPEQLIPELLTRFSSSEGYRLYPDVLPFFRIIRQARRIPVTEQEDAWPWDLTMIGIVTNSDDRVPSILSSLGLGVGARIVGRPKRVSHDGAQLKPSRNGYTVGMAPIGLPTSQRLDQLDEDIHFVVMSYDVGAEKPDPRIFQAAKEILDATTDGDDNRGDLDIVLSRRKWNIAPESEKNADDSIFLHIGDDVQKDVIGAQRAGFHSVLLDRDGKYSQAFEGNENRILSVPVGDGDPSTSHEMQVIQDLRDLRHWVPLPKNRRK